MKITVISVWYNEAILAPFFLTHYSYVDKIHIFLDTATNDGTEEMCKQYGNVEIEKFSFPSNMFDEKIKMRKINNFITELKSDWVYVLCSDEFIFPETKELARTVLARQTANLLYAKMWQSWRHKTETDLDPFNPSVYQRRHGSLLYKKRTKLYNKPIIAKPEIGIGWKKGQHSYLKNEEIVISKEKFVGCHWKNADIDSAVAERMERCERMRGQQNIDRYALEEGMRKKAEEHLNDPQMF